MNLIGTFCNFNKLSSILVSILLYHYERVTHFGGRPLLNFVGLDLFL